MVEHLSTNGKVYEMKVENLKVEMIYDKSNKKLDECMLNILKRKYKMN